MWWLVWALALACCRKRKKAAARKKAVGKSAVAKSDTLSKSALGAGRAAVSAPTQKTKEQKQRALVIAAGDRVASEDPEYKTLAFLHSDWSHSELETDLAGRKEEEIRGGRRAASKDPAYDTLACVQSDYGDLPTQPYPSPNSSGPSD